MAEGAPPAQDDQHEHRDTDEGREDADREHHDWAAAWALVSTRVLQAMAVGKLYLDAARDGALCGNELHTRFVSPVPPCSTTVNVPRPQPLNSGT